MISSDVWEGIDYVAFHENAILLDVKLRCQGNPTRSVIQNDKYVESQDGLTPQLIRNTLDDFALVVAGDGGKENVSAVCMEHNEELRMITLRISSNDGIQEQKLAGLQGLLRLITKNPDSGTELRREEILTHILQQCSNVFLKHVDKFLNELKQAKCPIDRGLRFPGFSTKEGTAETPADIDHLGPYTGETHCAFMQLSAERLRTLQRLSSDLTTSETQPDVSKMELLAKAAYNVLRSSSFDRLLRHNLLFSQKPVAVQSMAQSLKERLGKMSRLWRAAKGLTAFGTALMTYKVTVNVSCLPTSKHAVSELRKRTPAQLQARGGRHFRSCTDYQLQGKLALWQNYRLHCEMQLVVFYQENPHLQLRSRYIGCNKLACYLCYNFITSHGQFRVKGCHQGLHSLWTVPLTIVFDTHEQAGQFSLALRQLANSLEKKVDKIRKASKLQWKYRTNHESTANLSRISLQWPTMTGTISKTSTDPVDIRASRQLSHSEDTSRGQDSSDRDQKKLDKLTLIPIQGNAPATQSPQNKALDLVPSPTAGTAEGRKPQGANEVEHLHERYGDTENALAEEPSWQLDPILPASGCRNVSAPAVTSTVRPSLQVETGRKQISRNSESQDNTIPRASQEIGQSSPTPRLGSKSPIPKTSVSKEEKKSSQYCNGQEAEEYVHNMYMNF